jgi:hypothetical protein
MCLTPSAPAPIIQQQAPSTSSADVQAAADAERRRRALAAGQASTILTGGAGVSGSAPVSKPVLLGA